MIHPFDHTETPTVPDLAPLLNVVSSERRWYLQRQALAGYILGAITGITAAFVLSSIFGWR